MPMMKCGHAANATRSSDQAPVCVICLGKPEAVEVDTDAPDLSERQAVCSYSGPDSNEGRHSVGMPGRGYQVTPYPVPSVPQLAFFKHEPDKKYDRYFCGCWGWD